MHKKIYLSGIEKRAGKSFVSLGIVSTLLAEHIAFRCFKLFSEKDDSQKSLLEKTTGTVVPAIMDVNQAISMMRTQPDDLFGMVLEKTQLDNTSSLDYFEGTDFESDNDVYEFQFNINMAYQLNCSLFLVVSSKDRTLEHTLAVLNTAIEMCRRSHVAVAGIIISRVQDETEAELLFKKQFASIPFLVIIPEFEQLSSPSVKAIAELLEAEVLCGKEELDRPVRQFTIAAKTIGNFLESRLDRGGMLIITPDDRIDILLGSLLAEQSANYPKIAGIVLTGGEKPGIIIRNIITGLEHCFPVLLVEHKTYETATRLFSAKFSLSTHDEERVKTAMQALVPYLSQPLLSVLSSKTYIRSMSPAIFLYELIRKAKEKKCHIVLPEGEDSRILIAADYLLKRNVVRITLIGDPQKIKMHSKRLELELPNVRIIDIDKSTDKVIFANEYFKLRQHKNINFPIALERMTDVNYFAAMMVYSGEADGMVSGAAHTTADTVRPALEIIKTRPGISKVSSVFIMCMPTRVLIYGDCAINPEPDSETLAEIAEQAVDMARRLGISPKVALLSYSSGESGKGQSVAKVAGAMEILRQKHPKLAAEGPLQYDAAVDAEVAAKKMPDSKVAGKANVLIFPDLNTGNNTYKAVQRESGALAIGPVLLGLNKPINDLSRGCTPQDVINTILVTALQVNREKL
ncbi:phosphate acetyltransferase [Legionella quinlivanii]|uniref:Phosphate acetyltransferase n=1 Tax=Legionella quinlivanii TaxID=45073 RepID=A0A364LLW7_9GAMM|nr:phosphate acetyltransferase [Legionella quinlivanii]RAP37861.1 phosphate acetyltransferase [Legionella quinlivanii]